MELRAMNVGEMLDQTFKLYRKDFKSFLAIAAIGFIPSVIMGVLNAFTMYAENPVIFFGLFFIMWIPSMIVSMMMVGGLIIKTSELINDRDISIKEACLTGLRKFFSLIGSSIIYAILAGLGFLLLLIPGIFITVTLSLHIHAIMIENKRAFEALRRSRALIKGYWWRTFGFTTLVFVLVGILSMLVSMPFSFLSVLTLTFGPAGLIIQSVLSSVWGILLTPLSVIALTVYYYDLRIRKESLDLDVMVDNLVIEE